MIIEWIWIPKYDWFSAKDTDNQDDSNWMRGKLGFIKK